MEFYRDCPIDPDISSYYCLGSWEEEIRQDPSHTLSLHAGFLLLPIKLEDSFRKLV
jgi:hypothetical protein